MEAPISTTSQGSQAAANSIKKKDTAKKNIGNGIRRYQGETHGGNKSKDNKRSALNKAVVGKPPDSVRNDKLFGLKSPARNNTPNIDNDERNSQNSGVSSILRRNSLTRKEKTKYKKVKPASRSFWTILYETIFGSQSSIQMNNKYAKEVEEALNLQPWHLRRMRKKFDEMDVDRSGSVSSEEFLEFVGVKRSPFSDKLFEMIDLDGSGTIEFDEFVSVIALYSMFTKEEILKFCFECFDVDRSGTINEREFKELCRAVNGFAPAFPANFKTALEDFDANEDGLLDFSEFVAIERRYPLILFPAFKLQDSMQRFSLGEATWLSLLEAYHKRRKDEEYRRVYGKSPPEPLLSSIINLFTSWANPKVKVILDEADEASTPIQSPRRTKA